MSWLTCHDGALRRLGGIPAGNRIDNVRTAIASGDEAVGALNRLAPRSDRKAAGGRCD